MDPEDLERLAICAQLLGKDAETTELLTRAQHDFLAAGNPEGSARVAFWLGMTLLGRGEIAQAGGWLARAQRLVDDTGRECVEQGYLLLPTGRHHLTRNDGPAAYLAFEAAAAIGTRFGDRDLVTFARHGMGRAVLQQGDLAGGARLLDEAMVAVLAGEVSPFLTGIIYCSVIEACHHVFDLGRAREWTAALTDWCASQPDMVPFRGHCQIRRAQLMQLSGDWSDALKEARQADSLGGLASYQIGELHRLRGEFREAESAYGQASAQGRKPHPGLAQLRLIQGQVDAATVAIRRAADEVQGSHDRAQVLAASVDILLAAEDGAGARRAADELSSAASRLGAPFLHALAAHARGALLLADAEPGPALAELRRAASLWRELEAPYEGARTAVLAALACRALGDVDGGNMEIAAARHTFEQLGALPDLARLDPAGTDSDSLDGGGLTAREVQVLRLVASGRTNRAIAAELTISEKTVARHLSNIFLKLGLSSRAAATAYAYENGLARHAT